MNRRYSLSRAAAILIVVALMACYFAFARVLARACGEAAALLVLVVFVPLCTRLALYVESVARQRRRERVGKCECGYDVRATPERCPECGRVFLPCPSGEGGGEGASVVDALSNSHGSPLTLTLSPVVEREPEQIRS